MVPGPRFPYFPKANMKSRTRFRLRRSKASDSTSGLEEAQHVITVGEEGPVTASLPHPDSAEVSEDVSPIWTNSIKRYAKESNDEYKNLEEHLQKIKELKSVDEDTWLKLQNEETAKTTKKWLRTCKKYLPSFITVKNLVQSLANLDPHKVAPLVTAGAFVVIELCFGLIDPSTRGTAISLLLKVYIIVSKWVYRESDLSRLRVRKGPSNIPQEVEQIEKGLDVLYFDCLRLISLIYRFGKHKTTVVGSPILMSEWNEMHNYISDKDTQYEHKRSQVYNMLETERVNNSILNWIGDHESDPEPLHQTVKERTGVNDGSGGGQWFLETNEFTSWVDGIRSNKKVEEAFWLKGSVGTGKTTLLCRVISHFEGHPIAKVKFVPYYCHGSGAKPAPGYETILRALCRRLAWCSDGTVAEQATKRYDLARSVPDASDTLKQTWEPLLQELVASSSTTLVIVLDAIDECKDLDSIQRLLQFLTDLPRTGKGPYFLLSSQPHVRKSGYFHGSVKLFDVVQPQAMKDMEDFIDSQIESKKEHVHWQDSIFFKDEYLLKDLKSALLEFAGGMFRWVEVWIYIFFPSNQRAVVLRGYANKLLDELKNPKNLEKLSSVRSDDSKDDWAKLAIKNAYEKIWAFQSDDQYNDLRIRLFRIITAAVDYIEPETLLKALGLDPDNPDTNEDLRLDQIEPLYSSFLKVNNKGYLEYEHLSAKNFIDEIKDSDKFTFSSEECHRMMAKIAINAMKQPEHQIWHNAEIHMVSWGKDLEASLLSSIPVGSISTGSTPSGHKVSALNKYDKRRRDRRKILMKKTLGAYLFRYWLQHCQEQPREDQFIQQIRENFESTPGVRSWIIIQADLETGVLKSHQRYRDTLINPPGQALGPSPFLCMVNFGFSPFSHDTGGLRCLYSSQDVTTRNIDGKTALHLACGASNATIAKHLLEFEKTLGSCSTLLTMEDCTGRIPLHYAKNEEIINILLEYEAAETAETVGTSGRKTSKLLNWKSEEDETPMSSNLLLHVSPGFLRELLDKYIVHSRPKLLCTAVTWQLVDVVNVLLDWKEAKPGRRDQHNDMEEDSDPSEKCDDTEAFLLAVRTRSTPIVTLFLNHRTSLVNWKEIQVLDILRSTAESGDLEMLELLHNRWSTDYTILHIAVDSGNINIVRALLSPGAPGADIYATQGPLGSKYLHVAAKRGNIEMAKLLLHHGADIDAKPEDPGKPLAVAAYAGQRDMAEFLVGKRANVELLSEEAKTVLDGLLQNVAPDSPGAPRPLRQDSSDSSSIISLSDSSSGESDDEE